MIILKHTFESTLIVSFFCIHEWVVCMITFLFYVIVILNMGGLESILLWWFFLVILLTNMEMIMIPSLFDITIFIPNNESILLILSTSILIFLFLYFLSLYTITLSSIRSLFIKCNKTLVFFEMLIEYLLVSYIVVMKFFLCTRVRGWSQVKRFNWRFGCDWNIRDWVPHYLE